MSLIAIAFVLLVIIGAVVSIAFRLGWFTFGWQP